MNGRAKRYKLVWSVDPQARQYFSDAFPAYNTLYYGAPYEMHTDKLETYSVEAVNADLRHYLKRLARKSAVSRGE